MKMTIEQIKEKANTIGKNCGLVSFGNTVIYALHGGDNEARMVWFTIFDYDTPICEICAMQDWNGNNGICTYRKYSGWRYSPTTTKHTKQALELIAMAIDIKFGKWMDTNSIFNNIDKKDTNPFMGL